MKRIQIGVQFAAYLIVGGAAFVVDIGIFLLLHGLGLAVLTASAIGFVSATLVNYVLCYKLAFTRGRFSRSGEIARLFVVAAIGLVLNTGFVWGYVEGLIMAPELAKVLAVPPVLIWNYLGRRALVFDNAMPPKTQLVTDAATGWVHRRSSRAGITDSTG